jgi:putative transposase
MARMARVVVPGIPYHITQRGNRRQDTFFREGDYRLYRHLLSDQCARNSVRVWAYCLMPNHVHLVVVPQHPDGLHKALGEAHRRYTRHINVREDWRGYLWQGRFASFPMDERHLIAAVRYVELNPVRAHLCDTAVQWPWSSARAHLRGRDDELVAVAPMASLIGNWEAYLSLGAQSEEFDAFRRHARTGRPLGSDAFVERLEQVTGRRLRKRKPGPRPGGLGDTARKSN